MLEPLLHNYECFTLLSSVQNEAYMRSDNKVDIGNDWKQQITAVCEA